MFVDYHIHCEFSDDSEEKIEAQIEQAIKLGISEICFTDHVDYGIKKDWIEGNIQYRQKMPMANVDYPKYFAKLSAMQQKYHNRIKIKRGLELGIQTLTVDDYSVLMNRYGKQMDFALLSMHQVDNKEFWNQAYQVGKTQKEYNEGYYQEILNVIKLYKNYSVLAHLDLLSRYDKKGVYSFEKVKDIITDILKIAIKDNKGIEINTSSWHYKLNDTTPSKAILKLYYDLGGQIITVGSDAHTIECVGDHYYEAIAILKEIGFNRICTFDSWRPIFHEI